MHTYEHTNMHAHVKFSMNLSHLVNILVFKNFLTQKFNDHLTLPDGFSIDK